MKRRPFFTFLLAAVAAGAAGAGSASATTWLVPGDGSNTCTIVSPNCDTIAQAVAASAAADTIELAAGSHPVAATQNLVHALTITGAGIASTTVEPSAGVIAFDVRANGITFEDFTIQGGSTGIRFPATSDGTAIRRIAFSGNTSRGVDFSTGAGTPISNVAIEDSSFATPNIGIRMSSNSTVSGLSITGTAFTGNLYGIYQANDGNTSTLVGLTIDECSFTDNVNYSIYAEELRDSTIEDSTFEGGATGILILKFYATNGQAISNVAFRRNEFTEITGNALDIEMIAMGLDQPITIEENVVVKDVGSQTTAAAIFVRLHHTQPNGAVDFVNNDVSLVGTFGAGTAAYAVRLRGNGPVTFTGNTFDGGDVGGTGTTPATSGIWIESRSSATVVMPATTVISGTCNQISGFENGVSVFDSFNGVYGGLPVGATVSFEQNSIEDNAQAGVANGASPTLDFEDNWWGCSEGPGNPGCDATVGDVDADPALAAPPTCIACAPAPLAGCRAAAPGKSLLRIKAAGGTKDSLLWKWNKGDVTPKADFGNPLTDTDYQLCVYANGALASRATIPAGGTCAGKPCWKETAAGFVYRDKEASPEGITALTLKQGTTPGKAKIILKGKGANLDTPLLPIAEPVTVQLRARDGVCWETVHSAPAKKNTSTLYKDKND